VDPAARWEIGSAPHPFPSNPGFSAPLSKPTMSKPTKPEITKYKSILEKQLSSLKGDVGSMKDEALRASDQDASVDHLADQGTDNYDQGFMLGLIENEEETIKLIEEALQRIDGSGEWEFGICPLCVEETENVKKTKDGKKGKPQKAVDVWIPKARLEYLPWARYCVRHQEAEERNREIA
jgi:RNA polymerase-binding transcription factor DksA